MCTTSALNPDDVCTRPMNSIYHCEIISSPKRELAQYNMFIQLGSNHRDSFLSLIVRFIHCSCQSRKRTLRQVSSQQALANVPRLGMHADPITNNLTEEIQIAALSDISRSLAVIASLQRHPVTSQQSDGSRNHKGYLCS